MAEFLLGRLKFVWRGPWQAATTYIKDDIVQYGGRSYVCLEGHTSASTDALGLEEDQTKWNVHTDGISWAGVWTATTRYKANDIVVANGAVYVCTTPHVSGSSFDESKFSIYTRSIAYSGVYSADAAYKVGQVVTYGSRTYVCIVETSGVVPTDPAYWGEFVPGFTWSGEFSPLTIYKVNEVVRFGGSTYVSLGNDNFNNTPGISGSWALMNRGFEFRGVYNPADNYKTNDLVIFNGSAFVSVVDDNIAQEPSPISAVWKVYAQGLSWKSSFDTAAQYFVNDVVEYAGSSYVSIVNDNVNHQPNVSPTFWNLVAQGDPNSVTTTEGDMLYRGSVSNVRLPIGPAGTILQSDGVAPNWSSSLSVSGTVTAGDIVAGTITATGGTVLTPGTNVDQVTVLDKVLTLTTSWQDTGVVGSTLSSGSYYVQVIANDAAQGGGNVNTYYTGVMSWFAGTTTEDSSDEVVLHRAGSSAGAGNIFLRVQRSISLADNLRLQIAGTTNNTAPSTYTFKFRRVI